MLNEQYCEKCWKVYLAGVRGDTAKRQWYDWAAATTQAAILRMAGLQLSGPVRREATAAAALQLRRESQTETTAAAALQQQRGEQDAGDQGEQADGDHTVSTGGASASAEWQ